MSHFHEEQRFRQPWLMALLVVAAVLVIVVAATGSSSPWSAVFGIVVWVLAMTLVLAIALVVNVGDEELTVSFRYVWPTRHVALSDVESVEAVRYRPFLDYLGYGVRLGPKGLAYNVSGDRGVLVHLRRGGKFLIGSQRADELADAIRGAMEKRGTR